MVNGCSRKVRTNRAKMMATRAAWVYSKVNRRGLREIATLLPRPRFWPANYGTIGPRFPEAITSFDLEESQERLLGEVHAPDLLHPFLAFFLFLQELALAGDVAAVALGQHVLAHGGDVLAGDDLAADGGLDRDLEELARDHLAQLLRQGPSLRGGTLAVHDERQSVHRLAVHQDVQLHEVRLPPAGVVVIQGRVAARQRLEPVVEVEHHLVERQVVGNQDAAGGDVLQLLLDAPLVLAERQDAADVLGGGQDESGDDRLVPAGDLLGGRQLRRVADLQDGAVGRGDPVAHRRGGGDQGEPEVPLQPLLDDLHVEQPEKAAAEAETQRLGGLRLDREGRIAQTQLVEGVAQVVVARLADREEPGEHHG